MNKKSYRGLIMNLKQGSEFKEIEVPLNETVRELFSLLVVVERCVREALLQHKVITGGYICIITEGTYDYEIKEDNSWKFWGDFGSYDLSNELKYVGHVVVLGKCNKDDTVSLLSMRISDLKKVGSEITD